jgi:hypothetical protein
MKQIGPSHRLRDRNGRCGIDGRARQAAPAGLGFSRHDEIYRSDVVQNNQNMGAGECTITIVAGAIANAIFDATGVRIRQVPFTPARVRAALAARG